MESLIEQIQSCRICEKALEHGPRPVFSFSQKAKILLIGQAPGRIVHNTGIPWSDKSGQNLRRWLGVTEEQFYDPELFAIIPMGFCYPGKGKSGDLPPRIECAPKWHSLLISALQKTELTLLVGSYAQQFYLGNKNKPTLTETVREFRDYLPEYFALPHPSPRNNIWQSRNAWFSSELLPELQKRVSAILS